MPILADSASTPLTLLLVGAATAVAVVALVLRKPSLRGTTLVAPWYWSLVSLLTISSCEVWLALSDSRASDSSSAAVPLRFAAAMSTFCPMMALLGAKRPQDRAWQWIVLSLWAILSLPSIEGVFYGGVQEIHAARIVFLGILVGLGAANGFFTRFWHASILFCLGQIAILAPYFLPTQSWLSAESAAAVCLAAMAAAWTLPLTGIPRPARATIPLDRAWLDFRDDFGLVWSLRVLERMNASATMYDWPVALSWQGFIPRAAAKGESSPGQSTAELPLPFPPIIEESLRTLLRRFVSPEWIDARVTTIATGAEKCPTKAAGSSY